MSSLEVWRGRVGAALALLLVLSASRARAEVADPPVTEASGGSAAASRGAQTGSAAQSAGPLEVWLQTEGSEFDRSSLIATLEQELGRPVRLARSPDAAPVRIRVEGARQAEVFYRTPSGEQLSRRVDLPPDRQRAAQVVGWLTVNLVRDEASELLDELRARRKQEADARAAEERAAAEKAAADKAAADKAAADQAAAEARAAEARKRAEQAKKAENAAGGPPDQSATPGLLRDPLRSFDAALSTPLSLVPDSRKRALKLQLSLLYADAGGVEGLALSTGVERVRRDLFGITSAVAVARVGGGARGVVLSGGYSEVDGVLDGLLLGGGAAYQGGPFARGVLLSGVAVLASRTTGVEASGVFVSSKSLYGVAAAGVVSAIRGPSQGLLLAGGLNLSSEHRGVELSAGVNTARSLDGLAVAPVNVHRRVRGLQIGVVNVAEEVDGAAIGVISLAKNGRLQPVLWGSTDGSIHVGLKSVVGWAFTQLGAGIDLDGATFSYDGGIGAHVRLADALFLEPGIFYSASNGTADASGAPDEQQLHYLAQLGLRLGNKVDLLGAAGLRHSIVGGSGAKLGPELRAGIAFF